MNIISKLSTSYRFQETTYSYTAVYPGSVICEYVRMTKRRRTAVQMLAASSCVMPLRRVALSSLTFGSFFSSIRVALPFFPIFVLRNAVSSVLVSDRLQRPMHPWRPWEAFDLPEQLSTSGGNLHPAAKPLHNSGNVRGVMGLDATSATYHDTLYS